MNISTISFLMGACFLSFIPTYGQVGIPTSTPNGILDLNKDDGKNNLGLVLPKGELSSFQNVTVGTMVYDLTSQCVRVKGATAWGDCLPSTQNILADGNCFYHKGLLYCLEDVNGYYWLDRSLGSTNLAGNNAWFFQYGRGDEGHQISNSSTVVFSNLVNKPINVFESNAEYLGKFIINTNGPHWMYAEVEMKNGWDNKRAHLSNNPCPVGYAIPTSQQFIYYLQTKGYTNVPRKGLRNKDTGGVINTSEGNYWVSDTSSKKFTHMSIKTTSSNTYEIVEGSDAHGLNIKCIKTN